MEIDIGNNFIAMLGSSMTSVLSDFSEFFVASIAIVFMWWLITTIVNTYHEFLHQVQENKRRSEEEQ